MLEKNGILYDKTLKGSDKIDIEIIWRSNDMRVFLFQIKIGPFSRKTKIILMNEILHEDQILMGTGNFGAIYSLHCGNETFALKELSMEGKPDALFYALL